jgi:ubiquitin carboxyl-terminal hydrolase 47
LILLILEYFQPSLKDVPLCIRPFGSDKTFQSVEEALDAFVQPETLDENNQYFCSKCNKMCRAHKGLKFQSFPYILSLQLKRFDFDYNTMSRFKLSNSVTFPEFLNVRKYLNTDEEENDLQSSTTPIEKFYDYELFSIMIHSGSATGGHYYAYIKSFDTGQWYNFNDEKVTKLDRSDLSKAFGTSYSMYSSATAYMLLYRQINPARNENFIKLEESSESHIKESLEMFKRQEIEADLLKEYMENVCKVKVIVAGCDGESPGKSWLLFCIP